MKKLIPLLVILHVTLGTLQAQSPTNYGASSGTLGTGGSYFGAYSGNSVNSSSPENSFFGAYSGRYTTTGYGNTIVGAYGLYTNNSGNLNTAIGNYALYSNVSSGENAAVGYKALYYNTGARNNALGSLALYSNTSANNNTAIGYKTLYSNTTGGENTAIGNYALNLSTTSSDNTGLGYAALYNTTTGHSNTANGAWSMYSNTTGYENTVTGFKALFSNTTGGVNVAIGIKALYSNIGGYYNIASGYQTMYSNTSGSSNTAYGYQAVYSNTTGSYNVGIGNLTLGDNLTGNYNSAIGYDAGPNAMSVSNTTALGNGAVVTASDQVRIGNSSVGSIGGYQNWSNISDGRFKKDVKEDISGIEFINQLRPVSYILDRNEVDKFLGVPDSVIQQRAQTRKAPIRETGFIAQEVEKVVKKASYAFSGVEVPQNEKDHYSIRYAEFVVPLVKAVQELNTKVVEQQKKIDLLLSELNDKNSNNKNANPDNGAELFQNNPNPFSSDTEIKMSLPETAVQADLIIYAMDGKQLRSIQVRERGDTVVRILSSELIAGMYLYVLIVDGKVIDTKRMILTK